MIKFIKENKWKLLISCALILLPMLFGIIFFDELPKNMAIHFNAAGEIDGTGSKAFTVFAIPLIMLALHFFCILFTFADPKNRNQHPKAMNLIFWILPVVSLGANAMIYSLAFGREINTDTLMPFVFALIFIAAGNYMPKIKQNSTLGIKIVWALRNEENWNATHRFSGKVWVIGGALILISMLLPGNTFIPAMAVVLLLVAILPIVYSYLYYKKQLKNGTYKDTSTPQTLMQIKQRKIASTVGTIAGIAVFVFIMLTMFTGSIDYTFSDTSFDINASWYDDVSINYSKIDSIELRNEDSPGSRTNGFGSPRLLMGTFKNDEFGYYTRYTYAGNNTCIVMTSDSTTLVIGCKTQEETNALYNELITKIP